MFVVKYYKHDIRHNEVAKLNSLVKRKFPIHEIAENLLSKFWTALWYALLLYLWYLNINVFSSRKEQIRIFSCTLKQFLLAFNSNNVKTFRTFIRQNTIETINCFQNLCDGVIVDVNWIWNSTVKLLLCSIQNNLTLWTHNGFRRLFPTFIQIHT